MRVALVHDYLTQLGGAERVALSLSRAFPDAPLYTSLYEPGETFPEFRDVDVRPSCAQSPGPTAPGPPPRAALLRADVGPACRIDDADLVSAAASGWAHGVRTDARVKLVYCHAPARWLYQPRQYLGRDPGRAARAGARHTRPGAARVGPAQRVPGGGLPLQLTRRARRDLGHLRHRGATIVPPPPALRAEGPEDPVPGLERGYLLVVSRLMPYKNVDVAIAAAEATGNRLVVVGSGPLEGELRAQATPRITMLSRVRDDGSCAGSTATRGWCWRRRTRTSA